MERGAWTSAVYEVAEGRTQLSDFTFTFHFHALEKDLYNLAADIHEDHDLAEQYPEKVNEMKAIIMREHTHSDLFRVTLPE